MKKVLATLIAGFLVSSAFAQTPAAPATATTAAKSADSLKPSGEGVASDMHKTTPKAKHVKHAKKAADTAAK